MSPTAAGRSIRIDQLRGFAALAVVACHLAVSAYRDAPNAGDAPWPWLSLVLGFGYLGVPLFFVVSGFCIHLPQARALAAAGAAGAAGGAHGARAGGGAAGGRAVAPGWRRFFARRFWRLYPPYLAAIGVAAALLWLANGALPVPWFAVAAQALLVHTFHPATFDGLNPPAWTLAVEAQLYLAYPIVYALVARFGAWRALATIFAVTLVYRLVLNTDPLPAGFGGLAWELFLARWFEWVLGVVVAEWAVGRIELPRAVFSPALAAAVLALGLLLEWHTWHWGLYVAKEPFDGIAFALVLCVALGRESRRGAGTSPIGRYLAGVGVYSYSLYLLHRPIQLAFEPLARAVAQWPVVIERGIPTSLAIMLATTPVVLWASRLFYRWCELPCVARAQRAGKA